MDAKTIKMPAPMLEKWLTALRGKKVDGKPIRQAQKVMEDRKGGYCCLGVLQVCTVGAIETSEDEYLPNYDWLEQHGVVFHSQSGATANDPYLPLLDMSASQANDIGDTFSKLADAIEHCAEGY